MSIETITLEMQKRLKQRKNQKKWYYNNIDTVRKYYINKKDYLKWYNHYNRKNNLELWIINGLKARFADETKIFNEEDLKYIQTLIIN